VLEEYANATLTLPVEEQPAWFVGEQEPVMTVVAAAAAFVAGAAIVTGAYAAGAAAGDSAHLPS
jgi:hypothetical protein